MIVEAHGYDPVGNRMQQTVNGVVTSYTYAAADCLTSANGVAYTWDDNGNLTGDGTRSYTYDAVDRLLTVSRAGTTVQFTYNGVGGLVAQSVNGSTKSFALDVVGLPEVVSTSDGEVYLHLPGTILPVKE